MASWPLPAVALLAALAMMTLVWVASLVTQDASIVDVFWGLGFVVVAWIYLAASEAPTFFPWLPRRRPDGRPDR